MFNGRKALLGIIPVLFIANTLVLPVSILKNAQPIEDSKQWAQVPVATSSVTEVTLVSGSPVQMLDLKLPWPEVFNLDLVELNDQPVTTVTEIVLDVNDVLQITGMYSDLSVVAQSQGTSSILEFVRFSNRNLVSSQNFDLSSTNQYNETKVESPESIWVNQATLVGAITKNYLSDSEIVKFTLSQRTLDLNEISSSSDLFSKGVTVTLLNWLAFFSVFMLVGLFWLIGLFVWNSKPTLSPTDHFLRIVLGFTLFGLILNTANFFLTGIHAFLVAVASLVALIYSSLRKTTNPLIYFSDLRLKLNDLLRISIPMSLPLFIAFWPVFLFGYRFSGETKTDFSEYATLASFLRDSSMLAMQQSSAAQSAGVLTSGAGFSWRSIDSAVSSAFGTVLGNNSFYGTILLSMLAFGLFTLGLISLFSQDSNLVYKKRFFWVGLLATYPVVSTIFLESYLSQFVFVCLMPAVIVSITYFMRNPSDSGGVWTISALIAFLGALYPYFLAIMVLGISISLIANSKQTRMLLRKLVARTYARTALLLNVAILPILFYFETNVFQTALNDIARVTLLGPYSNVERLGLLGGVATYEWRHWGEAPSDYLGVIAKNLWTLGDLINKPQALSVLIFLVVAATVVVLMSLIRTSRVAKISDENHILVSVFVVWLGAFVFYATTGSTYVALKILLVAAVAWIVLVSSVVKSISKSTLIIFCTTLFFTWLPVNMIERSHWVVDPLMSEVSYSHVTTVNQIDSLRKFLSEEEYSSVFVAYGEEPLQGSDRDRTLMFNTKTVLRDLRIDCPDCIDTLPAKDLRCPSSPINPIIVIGATSLDQRCHLKKVFTSGLVTVFE